MNLLSDWKMTHNGVERSLELYQGDLSRLPDDQAVDLLVVSAFPNDYLPTFTSLIGALEKEGVSVAKLASDKELDLRDDFSCWISKPIPERRNFRRLLCVESGWRGTPPELADDVFRALAPASTLGIPHKTIAMPLIGAGDQGYPADQILNAILKAALSWFGRGLDVRVLKIVVHSPQGSLQAKKAFLEAKQADIDSSVRHLKDVSKHPEKAGASRKHDIFISYAHENLEAALAICKQLEKIAPHLRIFIDRKTLHTGTSWLLDIAESLDEAQLIVALYTPQYWASTFCKDEFMAAWIRQTDEGRKLLFPIHFEECRIPTPFKTIQFEDCREADLGKLARVSHGIKEMLHGLS
jgi:TIR domain